MLGAFDFWGVKGGPPRGPPTLVNDAMIP